MVSLKFCASSKHLKCIGSVLLLLACAFDSIGQSVECAAVNLKCEYLQNPIGIDEANPRLKWQVEDKRQNASQTAFQIIVGDDSSSVSIGKGNLWNTGKVASSSSLVSYGGKPLRPFARYYWTVSVWDKDGIKSTQSKMAFFETGLMHIANWKGSWITDNNDVGLKPAAYFRKSFSAPKKIKLARAYIAAAGIHELYINGSKVGDHVLDPAFTRYDRRVLYVSHDVTGMLQGGQNAVAVFMGNGWYNHQSTAVWEFDKAPWRGRPKFCMDIRVVYEDGSVDYWVSDKEWKTSFSPVTANNIYTGEHYDGRLEQAGWNKTDFNDSAWKAVLFAQAPAYNIVSQTLHPIREVEKLTAKSMNKINDSTFVFDLGKNISGVSQLSLSGEAGTMVRLKHAEQLYANGRVDQSNIDLHYRPKDSLDPFQTDIFILGGNGMETFKPRFNYKGFQYIDVTGSKPLSLTKESLVGYFMHSDVPVAGYITSSDTIINSIWKATNTSYLSNLVGYPTDCPQREKNGWTGDAHIAVETGLYNYDGITVYEKWINDHKDEQQPNGVLPAIIPSNGWGYEWANGVDWTSSIAIIPWNLYLYYGDKKMLEQSYDNIKRYVNYITSISKNHLTDWGLGDWVPVKSKATKELTSSIYYYVDAMILSKAAGLMNQAADVEKYARLSENIRNAINKKYLNQETGMYANGLQTELSAPLYWGIVPPALKQKVADNLARRVIADNKHVDVGLLGTKTILNALSENGYADLAYEVASQETFPSWGYWIKNGATTLYENWAIDAKYDVSRNHIMFGEIGAWFYKALGGIRYDAEKPGFKNVILKPNFVAGLKHFEAAHDGPHGKIASSWKREEAGIAYSVVIPANSSATVFLPQLNGKKIYLNGKPLVITKVASKAGAANNAIPYNVGAGRYVFQWK